MKVSPARRSAFEILRRIESEGAFSSPLLEAAARRLSPSDRSLCYELTLGTLRRQMRLDHLIDFLARGKKLDTEVRVALRMGIYQLRFLDRIPSYSAINESVNLVGMAGKASAKGLANAILRGVHRGADASGPEDKVSALALHESHPQWLVEKWITDHGVDGAEAMVRANNQIPPVAFRMVGAAGDNTFSSAGFEKSRFADGCYLADGIDRRLSELAERGEIYFQDEASQMVGNAVRIVTGGKILDVCASPGSKTTLIARRIRAGAADCFIAAGDLHAARVRILKANCLSQNAEHVSLARYDAESALPFAGRSFDSVLVDAPCSGTGTIRRNPEIRYRVSAESIQDLARKQLAILRNASNVVTDGGELIYSTCSIEPEENEAVCDEFLASAADFTQIRPRIDERFITARGFGRTFPHRDGMDGFFIASFRRA